MVNEANRCIELKEANFASTPVRSLAVGSNLDSTEMDH